VIAAIVPLIFGRGIWRSMVANWLIGAVTLIICANVFFALLGAEAAHANEMLRGWSELSQDMGQGNPPGRLEWYIQAYMPLVLALSGMVICQGIHISTLRKRNA